jgi:ribose 5-phosphate isomerase A
VWRDGVVTDNGNWILDLHGLAITDPVALERELNQIPAWSRTACSRRARPMW